MAKVEYEISEALAEVAPTQEQFEAFLKAMEPYDLTFPKLMQYMTDNGLFEAIALKAPLMGDWFDHDQ